jgi:hypothetical protein
MDAWVSCRQAHEKTVLASQGACRSPTSGAVAVGYANRSGKRAQPEKLHADVTTDRMDALADALVG